MHATFKEECPYVGNDNPLCPWEGRTNDNKLKCLQHQEPHRSYVEPSKNLLKCKYISSPTST